MCARSLNYELKIVWFFHSFVAINRWYLSNTKSWYEPREGREEKKNNKKHRGIKYNPYTRNSKVNCMSPIFCFNSVSHDKRTSLLLRIEFVFVRDREGSENNENFCIINNFQSNEFFFIWMIVEHTAIIVFMWSLKKWQRDWIISICWIFFW